MLTRDQYLSIIYKDLQTSNANVTFNEDGYDHLIAIVNGKIIYRFPKTKEQEKKLKIETMLLNALRQVITLKIPEAIVHYYYNLDCYYGVYPLIGGIQMKKEVFDRLSDTQKGDIAQGLAQFFIQIHQFSLETAISMEIQQPDLSHYWSDRLTKTRRDVYPLLSKTEQTWIEQLFKRFLKSLKEHPFQSVVSHSDIKADHIILDPKTYELKGIIDFGDTTIGDPAFDFGWISYEFSSAFLDEVLKSYLPTDNTFRQRIYYYNHRQPLAALERSLTRNDGTVETYKKELSDYIAANPHAI